MLDIDVLDGITETDFIECYVRENKPVVVRNVSFDREKWTPEFLKSVLGDLQVQVYDTLFALQEISTLSEYLNAHFGHAEFRENVPYVRWYNKLKDVDHAWGDEAFRRLSQYWEKPSFLPETGLLIPATENRAVNPVVDAFPYRGILIAAKGSRTRLHRDPFCSDAIVSQFYGEKEFIMYRPDRADELRNKAPDGTSFGGFIDVRKKDILDFLPEPDYYAVAKPGDVVYVPHGWLHDVLVLKDSLSITWNFIHEKGALEFIDYLMDEPEVDSEFEVLNYFYTLSGESFKYPSDILKKYNKRFADIENKYTL